MKKDQGIVTADFPFQEQYRHHAMFLLLIALVLYPGGLQAGTDGAASAGISGEDIYFQNCVFCHGDDATGNMPGVPDLTQRESWRRYSEDEMVTRLMEGVQSPGSQRAMPPAGGDPNLTAPQLRAAFRFMRDALLKPE